MYFYLFYVTVILYAIVLGVNMAGKKFYDETKNRLNLSLTKTAVKWLEAKQAQLKARSLSDAIERMAREQNETPDPPGDEQDQTLILNQEDSAALVKALLNLPLPNEALLVAAALYRQTIDGHPTKLTDVTRIEPVELSPIILQEISWLGRKFIFKNPLRLIPTMDEDTSQLFMVEEPSIGIHVFAYTRDDLVNEINEQILMMWDEYAQANVEDLTSDAQYLRKQLLNQIEEV